MIFTFSSCPLPALSRSPKRLPETSQKHSDTIPGASLELPRASLRCSGSTPEPPCDAPEAPRGVSRGPRSSEKPPQTPPKLPRASPRRPRSTPRHSRGSPEVPKSFPVTSRKPLRGSSRGRCAPTRRRNNKRYLLRSHWGTRPQRNSRPLADKITNEACFKATGERSHKAHVLAATEQEVNR